MRIFMCCVLVSASVVLTGQDSPAQRKSDYALLGSRIVTVKGVISPGKSVSSGPNEVIRFPDACTVEFRLKPGERAVEARQKSDLRLTPEGCELEMEVGQPPEDQLEPVAPPMPLGIKDL